MAQFCREISGFIAESSSQLSLCIEWHGKVSAHLAARNSPLAPRAMGMSDVRCLI
jgi:hypothetical protein